MVAIPCLLYNQPVYGVSTKLLGDVLIVVAAVLTVWSMLYYLQRAWPAIREKAL
jgi:CDP-diacylglycerol--glycerol-3-phosphate 3-phosphatidyltransferase/cardiolipin synthase